MPGECERMWEAEWHDAADGIGRFIKVRDFRLTIEPAGGGLWRVDVSSWRNGHALLRLGFAPTQEAAELAAPRMLADWLHVQYGAALAMATNQ